MSLPNPPTEVSGPPSPRVLIADETLEITHHQGDGTHAIVSFTGVGFLLGTIQKEEFQKSLAGTTNDLYFVTDRQRFWYNDNFQQIIDLLTADLTTRTFPRVSTLGNSMGGFGAILFARHLPNCGATLAFAPQSTVDPSIAPWETRYRHFTQGIQQWAGLDATTQLTPAITYDIFYGDADPIDLQHAARFTIDAPASLRMHLIKEAGHDVSAHLKSQNRLQPLINEILLKT